MFNATRKAYSFLKLPGDTIIKSALKISMSVRFEKIIAFFSKFSFRKKAFLFFFYSHRPLRCRSLPLIVAHRLVCVTHDQRPSFDLEMQRKEDDVFHGFCL